MTHRREIHEVLALDRASVRTIDDNGNLHISVSPLTRVQVAQYLGREIPGWEKLGLKPDQIYRGYRPPEELRRPETVASINGIPIQLDHHPDFPDDPAKETRVGATGDQGRFENPYLMNSLHIMDQKAIDKIKDGSMRELSLGYRYRPDFTPGKTPSGQAYDFVMRDISANHLALVEEGRAGHKVLVYDSAHGGPQMDTEQKEVAIAGKISDLAGKLKDLHTEENGKTMDKDESKAPVSDGGNEAVDKIIARMIEAGLDEEKAKSFTKDLEALAGSQAEDGNEELAETPAKEAEDGDEGEGDKPDENSLIRDSLNAAGMDGDDPDLQAAFKSGMNFKGGNEPASEGASDSDEECQDCGAKDTDEELAAEDEDGDAPLDDETSDLSQDSRKALKALEARFRAAEEVKSVLGKVNAMAYDSAAQIYKAALKKAGVKTAGLTKGSELRVAFNYWHQGSRSVARTVMAADAKPKGQPSRITDILSKVHREF